jgi:hypothetical protein
MKCKLWVNLMTVLMFAMILNTCGGGGGGGGGAGDGSTPSLLDGQTEFTGTFPSLQSVAYTTEEGDSLTAEFAFKGWVTLLVTPATPGKVVKDEVAANGGNVIDAIPRIGFYTISVAQGHESAFLSALLTKTFVLYGAPASPVVPSSLVAIDFFTQYPLAASSCGNPHGKYVAAVMERGGETIKRVNLDSTVGWIEALNTGWTFIPRASRLMINEMEDSKKNGERVVINLSLQSTASKKGDADNIRTSCSTAAGNDNLECRRVRSEQLIALATLLATIQYADPAVRDNTFVVISAGNAGVDLSGALQGLRAVFPEAFRRAVIVGATDTSGSVDKRMNYGSGIIYARGVNVPTLSGQICTGTSFAAPEVSRILDEMWRAAPTITSTQILDAFNDALATCPGAAISSNTLPQNPDGTTPTAFINCAIDKARAIAGLPPITPTPTPTPTPLPSGFPSNIPIGNYRISATVCAAGYCSGLQSSTVYNNNINQFAQTLVSNISSVTSQWASSCVSPCSCSYSITYTPWNSTYFTMTDTFSVTCCSNSGCSTSGGYVKFTINAM